jgi:hypothetical protein
MKGRSYMRESHKRAKEGNARNEKAQGLSVSSSSNFKNKNKIKIFAPVGRID